MPVGALPEAEALELARHLSAESSRPSFERTGADGHTEWVFFVPSLRCAACDWMIRRALLTLPGVTDAAVSLATLRVVVKPGRCQETLSTNSHSTFAAVVTTLARLGYRPYPPKTENQATMLLASQRKAWQQTALAGVCFGNAMLFAAAVYFGEQVGIEESYARFFAILSWALTMPCLLFSGRPFVLALRNVFNATRFGLSLDLPIGIALMSGFLLSSWQTFAGDPTRVYYDSLCGLVFFLTLGRTLQSSLLFRLQRSIARPQELLPAEAFGLAQGDLVTVAPGSLVPADGTVTRGSAEVDESILTGEARPALRAEGSTVYAGTQLVSGQFDMVATQTGLATRISLLAATTLAALERPTHRQALLQRAAPWLTAFILAAGFFGCMAALTQNSLLTGAERLLATLIVGCPCAFGLGVPLAYARAARVAARQGIIIKDMQALETLSACDTVLVDKTGTLTSGHLMLQKIINLGLVGETKPETIGVTEAKAGGVSRHPQGGVGEAQDGGEGQSIHLSNLELSAPPTLHDLPARAKQALFEATRRSHHPIAQALCRALSKDLSNSLQPASVGTSLSSFEETPGAGISWTMHDNQNKICTKYQLGSCAFVFDRPTDRRVKEPGTAMKLTAASLQHTNDLSSPVAAARTFFDAGDDGVYLLILNDQLRPEVTQTHATLTRRGIEMGILTGDSHASAAHVARLIAMDPKHCKAELSPEQKAAHVQLLQTKGKRVALVGDGINDAAAIAGATVGLAFTSGSALSQKAAGLCLTGTSFAGLQDAMDLSHKLRQTILAMLVFSVMYNTTTVGLALWGHITPLLAAVLMPSSSLVVALLAGRIPQP